MGVGSVLVQASLKSLWDKDLAGVSVPEAQHEALTSQIGSCEVQSPEGHACEAEIASLFAIRFRCHGQACGEYRSVRVPQHSHIV